MRLTTAIAVVLGYVVASATKDSLRNATHQSSNIIRGAYLVEFADDHVCFNISLSHDC